MKPINILNSYGLSDGLASFFKANHSVLVERNPYVASIIRVTIRQTTNTPGIMTPSIMVKGDNKYRLTVTGYTTKGTDAFIAIMNDDVHREVRCPVYLKCENRDIVLEFTTERDIESIKIFIVVAEPKLRQKFYISDICLQDLGPKKIEEPICPIPTEPQPIEPAITAAPPTLPEVLTPPAMDECKDNGQQPSQVDNGSNLSELLNAFHTYNKTNNSLNIADTSLTPVVLSDHNKELPIDIDTNEECCDSYTEPLPCIMNVYNNSFSMNNFGVGMCNPNGGGHMTVETKSPVKTSNIQLENIDLGVRVVNKQIKLLKVLSKHLDTLNDIVTKSYNSLVDEEKTHDEDSLKVQLEDIFREINFISLAMETDVNIFTPHTDIIKMPALIIDCRGRTISSTEYNVKIERYELGTRANELDDLFTLLFINLENGKWQSNHDSAYSRVSTYKEKVLSYHKGAQSQCDILVNRKAVLD